MIIGNPKIVALESQISTAFERLSFRALGCFTIHVAGVQYGVRQADATMLACSFDEVEQRLARRGSHGVFFSQMEAAKIAEAFRTAIYTEQQDENYFGISLKEFIDLIHGRHITWAPDGDAAFDDGSYILQFDIDNQVRVIAFKCGENGLPDPETLRDVWLSGDEFYCTLQEWRDAFLREWESLPKEPL
jgi:hypothetical protein